MGIEVSHDCPVWLRDFMKEIASFIKPIGFIGQLGFRYLDPSVEQNTTRRWLVAVYLVPHELAGGKHDGSSVVSGFHLSVLKLMKLFSEVSTLEWRVPRGYTDGLDGPEIWLEGLYRDNRPVRLHFYADPPSDESPDLVLDVNTLNVRIR